MEVLTMVHIQISQPKAIFHLLYDKDKRSVSDLQTKR